MISLNVDLGQIIVVGSIGIVGYFLRKEIATFGKRLDQHDAQLYKLVGDVQRLIGMTTFWNGHERRNR